MPIINFNYELSINESEIIRVLSGGRKTKGLSEQMQNRLTFLKANINTLLEPRAIYEILNKHDLPERVCFEEAEKVALVVCTIGEKLSQTVRDLMKETNLVDGIIIDAIGSTAVETVADKLTVIIIEKAKEMGLQATERYSPGFCGWELSDQQLIFDKLTVENIGVQLTPQFMMKPIKSVSFAINLGRDVKNSKWENRCIECEQENCSYRRK